MLPSQQVQNPMLSVSHNRLHQWQPTVLDHQCKVTVALPADQFKASV